ncbi:pyridoxal phosphate-dependent transferase [Gorgonomyces haynaldii]|nr:pyridoxal phosphate-dependent transferase [Gorgonomyces haynaldii]
MSYILSGSNTNIGKTIVSTVLCRTNQFAYLKPVQTGYPTDSDARFVGQFTTCPTKTLFAFPEPVSPHFYPSVSDQELLNAIRKHMNRSIIEMAGGVLSPVNSGRLQADVMRPLMLPHVLVGDHALGGISTTLASYEALRSRGYKVPLLVMFDGKLKNQSIVERNVDCPIVVLEQVPEKTDNDLENLKQYFAKMDPKGSEMLSHLLIFENNQVQKRQEMQTEHNVWWPFTQHKTVKEHMVVDAAQGDHFIVHDPERRELFDGCASWWTNGLGHGNLDLAKAASYAASRYGHVIAPETLHEPMHDLAKKLVQMTGFGSKVFFTDNGSTAIEVALKMAFSSSDKTDVKILGLKGSYHGDTIGSMDLSDPNVYNKKVHWYTGKGYWLDPPCYQMVQGKYHLGDLVFDTVDQVFAPHKRLETYKQEIREYIQDKPIGALVIEPIVMGAGGMLFVDPLYQKAMIQVSKEHKIPVIFDEVFVGMFRCGVATTSELLGEKPDIACYAKAMTGGLLPLAATVATEEVFERFQGDSKLEALLHGHSYTAHPVGCQVALESLKQYEIKQDWTFWNADRCKSISHHPMVERVNHIGTILAVELKSQDRGYLSTTSKAWLELLNQEGIYCRPLGNLVYFICGHTTTQETLNQLLDKIEITLNALQSRLVQAHA